MNTMRLPLAMLLSLALAPCALIRGAPAAEQHDSEAVAAKLAASTVTIRISVAKPVLAKGAAAADEKTAASSAEAKRPEGDSAGARSPEAERADQAAEAKDPASHSLQEVTVCSGVSLGKGLIITFHEGAIPARIRVTLTNGEQAEAEPRVIDHYSGLQLLEIKDRELPGLDLAETTPAAGAPVWTAAAAGLEKPAVSLGILSSTDRSLPGTDLPPLVQCDLRTTETSSGAAILNRAGQLVAIVAATAAPGERSGWTYGVPVEHIRRLQRALVPNQLIELKRQRPVAGLTIGAGDKEGTVVVERVVPGGPAALAGLKTGDLVLEAEGRKIRSAYQAVELILRKQPGEKISFVVQRVAPAAGNPAAGQHAVELTLGGAAAPIVSRAGKVNGIVVGPQLTVKSTPSGVEVRNSSSVQELSVDSTPRVRRSAGDEVDLLRTQLVAFEEVIHKLQAELQRRGEIQQETDKLLKSLQDEVDQLHKQLDDKAKR